MCCFCQDQQSGEEGSRSRCVLSETDDVSKEEGKMAVWIGGVVEIL